ncbi:MAG: HAMP domain-containing protein [Chlorobium sp.]|nr:MAG: HAMP domain-containing protein [Chlorobium sp.]
MTGKPEDNSHENRSFWKRFFIFSLRNRIAFYYTVATAFLIAVVFTIIYFLVERVVYQQFDEELRSEISELFHDAHVKDYGIASLSQFRNIDFDDKGEEKDDENEDKEKPGEKGQGKVDVEFIQFVDHHGSVYRKTENLLRYTLVFRSGQTETCFFNSRLAGSTIRQVQVPLKDSKGLVNGYMIVAVPMKNAIIVLYDLQNVLFLSFPLIILTLFILTRLIAGKSIMPIDRVIATAEQISQTNLDQRIMMPRHRDELYRLSATINSLLDRMQDAFLREKQFTADASHELKTPLSVVKGHLEVLIRKPREREYYESKVKFCLVELNRMAQLIDQLLMLARFESDSMHSHIESVQLSLRIDDVVERMKPLADEKEIMFRLQKLDDVRVAADSSMLEMILENIISNAVKYSPSGSMVTIRMERKSNMVACHISDEGIGIPDEQLQSVFERFYRVDQSRSSNTGGFGLGLSIVKKLADLQKIRVTVASSEKGTTFTLVFPSL